MLVVDNPEILFSVLKDLAWADIVCYVGQFLLGIEFSLCIAFYLYAAMPSDAGYNLSVAEPVDGVDVHADGVSA